jgi:hypothetical protein
MFFLMAFGIAIGQDVNISASVDRNIVGLGESITLTISLSGGIKSMPKPILPDLSDFEVYTSGTSSSFSIGIGAIKSQTTYNYNLVPRKAGTFTIQSASVEVNGKIYSSAPITITVQQSQQKQQPTSPPSAAAQNQASRGGGNFFLEQTIDNTRPYVGQQTILTFRFYQAVELYQQPSVKWPDYNGFWVEDLPPNRTYNTSINGRVYRVTEIKRALFPTVDGKKTIEATIMTIPPDAFNSVFNDPFGMFGRRQNQRFAEQVLRTDKVVVDVKPLPSGNKPANFTGAVGRLNLAISIDKDTVEVDQPVTLRAVLGGSGNIKKLPAIDVPKMDNFRLYDSGSNENVSKDNYTVSGSKDFEWVLIPTAPGDYEIPQVNYAYFDPDAHSYKTLSGKPGRVHVKPSLSSSASLPGGLAKNIIPAAKTSLNYIVTDLSGRRTSRPLYDNSFLWAIQVLPLGWLAFLTIYMGRKKKLEGDLAYARRKMASKAARKALKAAHDGLGNPEQFFGLIYTGVIGFIADKTNVSVSGLTNVEIIELLKKTGKCDNFLDDFASFLNNCDAGRFSPAKPTSDEMNAIYAEAERLLSALDRSLK